ncbi:MAG: CRTAC1 family protein [Acidobacteriota bacterium]|nr:CRTAC1 family protein [Acidobacteriota bacterium]
MICLLRPIALFVIAAVLATGGENLSFTNVAAHAGLTVRDVSGDDTHKKYLPELNGSGIAFIDYNNDGLPDIFVINGTRAALSNSDSAPISHLYRNNGDGTFTDVTFKAGVGSSGWGQGACVGDYDNDGWDDLFVTYYGHNRLFHNNGDGTFTDVADTAGLTGADGRWNTGCAFIDYNRDGRLDLFIASYVDLGPHFADAPPPGSGEFCQYKGMPIACGPRGLKASANHLFRNEGNGMFSDVSESSGILRTAGHYSLGVLTLDYDRDGWPDIYVACDSAPSILLHNNRDGTFQDAGLIAGTAFNEDGETQAGMGVAAADYDHDGNLDIVKTNFSDDSPNLYLNKHDGTFSDRVFESGLGRLRSYLGWGVLFADFDNDGWSDILMVNGHLTPEIDSAAGDSRFRQRKLLYRNLRNGHFEEISTRSGPGLSELHSSRGAAVADLFNDGRLSVIVNELDETPSLLILDHPTANHWLGIRTVGSVSNRDGVGAAITARSGSLIQVDEVRSGGGYLSQNDLRIHFGLGAASKVDELTVSWPSGRVDHWRDIPADQQIVVHEGALEWSVYKKHA